MLIQFAIFLRIKFDCRISGNEAFRMVCITIGAAAGFQVLGGGALNLDGRSLRVP